MKISSNSWIIRWAYWLDDMPDRTNICAIFWRVVLVKPLLALFAGVIVYFIFLLYPLVELLNWLDEKRRLKRTTFVDVIRQRVSDWKSKTCTRVEIIDEN